MRVENEAQVIDPIEQIRGPVLVVAPHSDDETLGCGATLALLARAVPVHVAYATDGRLSPSRSFGMPVSDWQRLVAARKAEAKAAMMVLGVEPGANDQPRLHFLGLEDANLQELESQLADEIRALLVSLEPQSVFIPFRYDQNPDHLAVHRAAAGVLADSPSIHTYQYFVYYRYPLLAERDIRKTVNPEHCVRVDMGPVAERKRRALDCYKSQVDQFYPWQERPLLRPELLDEHCQGFEYFVTGSLSMSDNELFQRNSIRLQLNLRYGAQVVTLKKRIFG